MAIDGTRVNGFVYADGELIASLVSGAVYWQHHDASDRSLRTTGSTGELIGRDEVDPRDVSVDDPGQPAHYHGGNGGGSTLSAGGGDPRPASLMNTGFCSWSGMLVPCAMIGSFQQHIDSLDQGGRDHWNGVTTWTFTVTATFRNGQTKTRTVERKGGFFAYKTGSVGWYDGKLTAEAFTDEKAATLAMAGQIIMASQESQKSHHARIPQKPAPEGYVNQDILAECVQLLFTVTMGSFRSSKPGQGGLFIGTGPLSILGGRSGEISIFNNVTAMNTSDLRDLSNAVRRQNNKPLLPPSVIVLGYSPGWLDHTNYSARNQTPQMLVETHVHELGHTINHQIKNPLNGEAGQQLEHCVREKGGFRRS